MSRLLDRRGRLGDPLRGRGQGRRAAADRRPVGVRSARLRRAPLRRRSSARRGYVGETSAQNFVRSTTCCTRCSRGPPRATSASAPSTPGRRNSARSSSRAPAGSDRTGTRPTPRWWTSSPGVDPPDRDEWAAKFHSPIAAAEAWRTRTAVALYDMTPLKRLEVCGPGALALLERLTTGKMDKTRRRRHLHARARRSGRHPQRLHGRPLRHRPVPGRRERRPRPRLPPPASALRRSGAGPRHHRRHLLHRPVGPASPRARPAAKPRRLLERRRSSTSVPSGHASAASRSLAMRLSYVGELGWEIYTTADNGLRLWDVLWAAGQASRHHRRRPGGVQQPAAGEGLPRLGPRHDHRAQPVRGRPRLRRARGQGRLRRPRGARRHERRHRPAGCPASPSTTGTASSSATSRSSWTGQPAGYVTSAAFGHTIGRPIAYAWLPSSAVPGTAAEIEYFGNRIPATVVAEPVVDPDMTRIRR